MDCEARTNPGQDANDLAGSLRRLLEEQLAAGREGDLSRVAQLGEQADALVARILRQGGEAPALEDLRRDLKGSYDDVVLMLRAEQSDVQSKLTQLRRMRRVIGAYRTEP
jgi:hypothetical protein